MAWLCVFLGRDRLGGGARVVKVPLLARTPWPTRPAALPVPPSTVYKTKLVATELSADFDEYIMTIEQVIKSGTQPSIFPALWPLSLCRSSASPSLLGRLRRGAGRAGTPVHQPHQVQERPEVGERKEVPHVGAHLGPLGRKAQVSTRPAHERQPL